MGLLFINLLCGAITKARKSWRTPGMLIAHSGMLLMIVAGLVAFLLTRSGSLILYERADLGLRFEEVENGAAVVGLAGNEVGKEAGIKLGDVLVGVTRPGEDGEFSTADDLQAAVSEFRKGEWALGASQLTTGLNDETRRLKLLRDGEEIEIDVEFGGQAGNESFNLINWSIEVGEYTGDALPKTVMVIPPAALKPLEKKGARRVFFSEKLPFEIEISEYLRNCMPAKLTTSAAGRTVGQGLGTMSVKVYAGDWQALPDFTSLEATETLSSDRVNVELAKQIQGGVGMVFQGELQVPADGSYTFKLGSDQGSRLKLEGKEIVAVNGVHGMLYDDGVVDLKAGAASFELEYFGGAEQRELALSWSGPGFGESQLSAGQFYLREMEVSRQEEQNMRGARVTVLPKGGGEPIAESLLMGDYPGSGMTFPLTVDMDGKRWAVNLTKERMSLPFKIRLEDFTKIDHPGTSKPKEFMSQVTKLNSDGTSETKLIEMNNPLRSDGYIAYQASWGPAGQPEGTVLFTSLAISTNPADQWPKYSCYIVAIGLLIHFFQKLYKYLNRTQRKRERERAAAPKAD